MKKFELLNLENCNTNEEITNAIKNRVKEITLEELNLALSKKFVQYEKASRIIYTSLATGGNCILYGPGGYAKSALIKSICNLLGIPLICKVGYKNMTPEELFGTPNMKKMLEESKYETAFENSVFCQKGVLIIEEALDMAPQTAAALKDILTERGFREGSIKKDSLISSIILTGNKDPNEESIDDSIRALYLERFPYRCNVIWDNHAEKDYLNLFKVLNTKENFNQNQEKFILVSRLCENSENLISPRTAELAGNTAINLGVDFLDTVSEIDTSLITSMKEQILKEKLLLNEKEILNRFKNALKELTSKINTTYNLEDQVSYLIILEDIDDKLKSTAFSDESFEELSYIKNSVISMTNSLKERLKIKIGVKKSENFINNFIYHD